MERNKREEDRILTDLNILDLLGKYRMLAVSETRPGWGKLSEGRNLIIMRKLGETSLQLQEANISKNTIMASWCWAGNHPATDEFHTKLGHCWYE